MLRSCCDQRPDSSLKGGERRREQAIGGYMSSTDLTNIAQALVADGKGILAADETVGTVTKRLDAQKIESTPDSRRTYREMFFTTPAIGEFISGVILQDETIHQKGSQGIALAEVLSKQGIIPGIKVDTGAK